MTADTKRAILTISRERCVGCGYCRLICSARGMDLTPYAAVNDHCVFCWRCIGVCPVQAISREPKANA